MGMGSWLSRFLARISGGALRQHRADGRRGRRILLVASISRVRLHAQFRLALYALVIAVGVLVGLEIPLLMRILRAASNSAIWSRTC